MEILGVIMGIVGAVCGIVSSIWLIVLAFKDSVLWGFLCLCLWPFLLIFAIINFKKAKMPVIMLAIAILLTTVGKRLAG